MNMLLFALLLAASDSAPPDQTTRPPETPMENVAARTVKDPVPACQANHDSALSNGTITIKPGEVLCVQLQTNGDELVPLAVVDKANSGDTLVIRFWQEPNTREMYLVLNNPADEYLQYEASMLLPGRSESEHTSTCPVLSKRTGLEQWPFVIDEISLTNFRLLRDPKTLECL